MLEFSAVNDSGKPKQFTFAKIVSLVLLRFISPTNTETFFFQFKSNLVGPSGFKAR